MPLYFLRQRMFSWARRTEGKLALMVAAVVVTGLAAGIVGAVQVSERSAVLEDVAGHSGPLTVAAIEAYRALSDADATSASAFLAGGAEPAELRTRYQNDIAAANAALSTAASGAPEGESAAKVAELANHIPTYTGLVETARAYNRQGLPLGAAYLREASELVRTTMLPAAQRLYELEAGALADSQASASEPAWAALVLSLLLIGCLVAIQLYLRHRMKRLLNLGLLVATALALTGLVWLTVSSIAVAADGATSRQAGTEQIDALAEARIAGLQARSDEAMTLVARGNGAEFDQHFDSTAGQLTGSGGLLEAAVRATDGHPGTRAEVDQATAMAGRWLTIHKELRTDDIEGRYNAAVQKAIGTGAANEESAGSLAFALDGHLGQAIEQANARFDGATRDARNALSGLAIGLAALCALAVAAAAVGLWQRIAEYR